MVSDIVYLILGVLVGYLCKYEIDLRATKKRIAKKMEYLRATAKVKSKGDDNILESLKNINDNLRILQEKEVR